VQHRRFVVVAVACGCCGARVGVASGVAAMTTNVYRLPICSGGNVDHRHGRGCFPLLVRALPAAPTGWKWEYGHAGNGWGIWLGRVGGAGGTRWHVLGLPASATLAGLVSLVESFAAGYRGVIDGPT
jgi:hypothetical protein